jgi:vacuolar-type H+-ATPase subunit H
MTSIIWYIYNESLKKERELLEKARKKIREKKDRIRNIGKDPDSKKNDK